MWGMTFAMFVEMRCLLAAMEEARSAVNLWFHMISHGLTTVECQSQHGTCMTNCSTSKLEWCLTRAWLRSFSADTHLKMTLKVDTKSRHWSCRFNFSGLWIYHSPPSMFSWIWAMLCESHTPIWLQAYDLQYETRSHMSMTHCCKCCKYERFLNFHMSGSQSWQTEEAGQEATGIKGSEERKQKAMRLLIC